MATKLESNARVQVLLARKEPKAVLIVQKRSKLFHIVSWNYLTDEVNEGSWFKGKIYSRRCDLSFDGRFMVYFALGPTTDVWSWTAVCEPPFLKAMTLWEHDSTWFGGGVFLDEKSLYLDLKEDTPHRKKVPSRNVEKIFNIRYLKDNPSEKAGIQRKLENDGWKEQEFTSNKMLFEKEAPNGRSKLVLSCSGSWESDKWDYQHFDSGTGDVIENSPIDEEVRWADWDCKGRLFTVKDGIVQCHDSLNDFTIVGSLDCNRFHKD